MLKKIIHAFFVLFLCFFFYGNIYFWVDENGTKHFTNISPPWNETFEELSESHIVSRKLRSPKNKTQLFTVLKIYDGDTIKVKGLGLIFKIRLVGIDCPEIGYNGQKSQPFGREAKHCLTALMDNKKVAVKSYGIGSYNRQLAEVFVEDKNINIEMIKAGLAEVYKGRRPKGFDSQIYLIEESRAKREGKGMWIQGDSRYKSPRQWRKEHPRK